MTADDAQVLGCDNSLVVTVLREAFLEPVKGILADTPRIPLERLQVRDFDRLLRPLNHSKPQLLDGAQGRIRTCDTRGLRYRCSTS